MQYIWEALENPTVLIVISGIASLPNYVILWHPGFGWPAQLHGEGAIPSVIIGVMAFLLLDTCRLNRTSPTTNNTMLVEDIAAQLKTSSIIQFQLQTVEYVNGLAWIVHWQERCRFEYCCIA